MLRSSDRCLRSQRSLCGVSLRWFWKVSWDGWNVFQPTNQPAPNSEQKQTTRQQQTTRRHFQRVPRDSGRFPTGPSSHARGRTGGFVGCTPCRGRSPYGHPLAVLFSFELPNIQFLVAQDDPTNQTSSIKDLSMGSKGIPKRDSGRFPRGTSGHARGYSGSRPVC